MKFSGDDIASAFNRPLPSTRCRTCGHERWKHRRVITNPDLFNGSEEHFECQERDRRRKSGVCPCEAFSEPEVESNG